MISRQITGAFQARVDWENGGRPLTWVGLLGSPSFLPSFLPSPFAGCFKIVTGRRLSKSHHCSSPFGWREERKKGENEGGSLNRSNHDPPWLAGWLACWLAGCLRLLPLFCISFWNKICCSQLFYPSLPLLFFLPSFALPPQRLVRYGAPPQAGKIQFTFLSHSSG